MSSGTKVYNFVSQPDQFKTVLDAIAKSEGIVFLCGPDLLASSGMPSLSQTSTFCHNTFDSQLPLSKMIVDCSEPNGGPSQLSDDQLAAYNKVMAARRIQARGIPSSPFHQYFHRVFALKRVVKYLTTSFDAVEVLRKRVAEIKRATSRPPAPAAKASRRLCPAVLNSMASDMLPGARLRNRIVAAAKNADLLLIAGISLQSDEIMDLVREIAEQVHRRYGGVVYIGEQPSGGRGSKYHVDFHLQMTPDKCAGHIQSTMNRLEDADTSMESAVGTESEKAGAWCEIINNEIESLFLVEEPELNRPQCFLCNTSLEECLLKCRRCGDWLCYTGPYHTNRTAPCVVLQMFRDEANKPSIEMEIDAFCCMYCWNHSEEGPYPHSVKPAPWVAVQERGRPAPRMIMIIYFLDQFWPQAKHLRNLVAGKWAGRGWSAHVEPVRLENLHEPRNILPNFSWDAKTYNVFVIYITHGISSSKGYQISPTELYPAPQFLEYTLTPVRDIILQANHSLAIFACCGYPFLEPQKVWDLQLWLNRSIFINSIIGCLNEKLSPAFLLSFIGKLTTVSADDRVYSEDAMNSWMSSNIAVSHTDLIYLQRLSPPVMWLFSPFDTRPLGKELPHILTACKCRREEMVTAQGKQTAKVWKVSHNATIGMPLSDVRVKVSCSICRQMWVLPSEHLKGKVYSHAGLYCSVVPYFAT
ncbi:helicase domain-containing protein [Rhizoctonia solani]|uniref:Helicase domain-containing protein n=1 Tax=Rhizoctonia solani TaxID=456999 RepID=A0A8H8SZD1_9AGAM|nr:helicase domain-containing protein [Rhizoctonia solani]QRW22512.1 helicase domain-containing protein [Rhizoctonia solani]